jgi:hypothetical protein
VGTTNAQTKVPVASVVMVVPTNVPSEHEEGVWRTESNRTIATDETLNPDPVTVYGAPVGPCAGFTTTAGVVIRNEAVAPSKLPSDPVAVTVYAAAAPPTRKVQPLNPPVPLAVHALAEPMVPSDVMVNVMVTPGVNPLPEAVTDAPLGPWVGTSVTSGVVTVNVAVASSKLPSDPVAVSVYGVADAVPVTVTVQLNVPVLVTVAPQAPIAAPAPIVVVTVLAGVNPVPDTPTDTPLGPWVKVRVILGVVTVKGAVARSAPPSEPVAVTVYVAVAPLTVNVHPLSVPVPLAVQALAEPIVPPALIEKVTVTLGVNPVPVAVTVTPVGPCVGTNVMAGTVTRNDAVALSAPPSDPVAVTVYVAAAPLTVNVQPLNAPVPLAVHALAEPIVPPAVIEKVIVTPGVNPLPDAVTVTPLSPWVGTSVIAGTVTKNDAVALSKLPSEPVAVTV